MQRLRGLRRNGSRRVLVLNKLGLQFGVVRRHDYGWLLRHLQTDKAEWRNAVQKYRVQTRRQRPMGPKVMHIR